ncbi:PREDICTED: uncharacterized protein LOC108967842 [Bactrocera latifrons]|uniref:uncharacterized protein LOC108967842 n=1 Tax=Bactrocera latifrons TaxID=174628 RepID=UPI0008DDC50D|nr:PREDICTED: uncharacterized protein LOC108967842 [Bactrocera latifrons]
MEPIEVILETTVITLDQLMNFTIGLTEAHCHTQIHLSHDFITRLLKELNALPEKTEYIQAQIQRVTNILESIDMNSLNESNSWLSDERLALLDGTTQLFVDLNAIAKSEEATSDTVIIKKVLDKADLQVLFKHVDDLVNTTDRNFGAVFHQFFRFLGDEERKAFPNLSLLYDEYQTNSLEGKFKNMLKLYEMFNYYKHK